MADLECGDIIVCISSVSHWLIDSYTCVPAGRPIFNTRAFKKWGLSIGSRSLEDRLWSYTELLVLIKHLLLLGPHHSTVTMEQLLPVGLPYHERLFLNLSFFLYVPSVRRFVRTINETNYYTERKTSHTRNEHPGKDVCADGATVTGSFKKLPLCVHVLEDG